MLLNNYGRTLLSDETCKYVNSKIYWSVYGYPYLLDRDKTIIVIYVESTVVPKYLWGVMFQKNSNSQMLTPRLYKARSPLPSHFFPNTVQYDLFAQD